MKKRIVCLLLAVLLIGTLSACGKKEADKPVTDGDAVDVEYYVKLGQMPECKYQLGNELDKLRKELSAAAEAAEENGTDDDEEPCIYNEFSPTDGVTGISTGGFDYYCRSDREEDGLAYIVCYGDAYGFETGTLGNEIKDQLSAFDTAERDADPDELFFLPSITQFTVLEYPFGENVVLFVLQDNALCATALYRPAIWSETT